MSYFKYHQPFPRITSHLISQICKSNLAQKCLLSFEITLRSSRDPWHFAFPYQCIYFPLNPPHAQQSNCVNFLSQIRPTEKNASRTQFREKKIFPAWNNSAAISLFIFHQPRKAKGNIRTRHKQSPSWRRFSPSNKPSLDETKTTKLALSVCALANPLTDCAPGSDIKD